MQIRLVCDICYDAGHLSFYLGTMAMTSLEQRVVSLLKAYDAQGNHRTGTAVDHASAHWLAQEIRRLGIEPSLEPFALSRVDPQLTYARIGDRRIDGVPMFDGAFTPLDGVSGRHSAARQRLGWQR